jgi:riboflavin synthase
MFTGLVTAIGTVAALRPGPAGARLDVDLDTLAADCAIGDSIALSGVCCTVVALAGRNASFDLSPETLRRTWLGQAVPGTALNLEPALRAGAPLGGHFVQGHVDGVGRVETPVGPEGGDWVVRIPAELGRYTVEKGSIACDGVSLTIAALAAGRLTFAVIPHTAQVTTIGRLPAGAPVHLEADVLAKYVERLLATR